MARTDDGEFELILGNKQLLVVFFIVVVLLGVFFAMGYIVGKNSGQPDFAGQRDPLVVEPTSKPSPTDVRPTGIPRATPRSMPTQVVTPAPLRDAAPTPRPKPTPEPELPKPAVKKATETKAAEGKGANLASNGEPAPGQSFLQVVASTRPDCEVIVDVLKKKGFTAMVAPGPNETLFRVLVGPLKDAATITKTRSDLEAAGFQKPILRKY